MVWAEEPEQRAASKPPHRPRNPRATRVAAGGAGERRLNELEFTLAGQRLNRGMEIGEGIQRAVRSGATETFDRVWAVLF